MLKLVHSHSFSPYTASRPRGHSRQVGAVVLKEEEKYRQKNKEGIVRRLKGDRVKIVGEVEGLKTKIKNITFWT